MARMASTISQAESFEFVNRCIRTCSRVMAFRFLRFEPSCPTLSKQHGEVVRVFQPHDRLLICNLLGLGKIIQINDAAELDV
jgi:hypothetical protein